jgi:hypothetical protein
MTKATTKSEPQPRTTRSYITVEFYNISEPGTYVCNWSGHLLRVPEDGVTPGRSPMIDMIGTEPLWVTKISDDPYITRTKARIVASNYDVYVNF